MVYDFCVDQFAMVHLPSHQLLCICSSYMLSTCSGMLLYKHLRITILPQVDDVSSCRQTQYAFDERIFSSTWHRHVITLIHWLSSLCMHMVFVNHSTKHSHNKTTSCSSILYFTVADYHHSSCRRVRIHTLTAPLQHTVREEGYKCTYMVFSSLIIDRGVRCIRKVPQHLRYYINMFNILRSLLLFLMFIFWCVFAVFRINRRNLPGIDDRRVHYDGFSMVLV